MEAVHNAVRQIFNIKRLSVREKLAIVMLFAFLISIIPLFIVGLYTVPSPADDYAECSAVHFGIEQGKSFVEILKDLYNVIYQRYMNWQGTYSVYFVINCAPLAFSNDAQWLVPIFLISGFLLCLLYFVQQLLHTLLKLRQANILALFVLIAFCCVQLLPSPKEAFYWASGGIMYTGFFSGMLLLLGMVLRFYTIPHKRAIWFDLSTIISFIVAGGNYPTALIQCEILFVLMMMAFLGEGMSRNNFSLCYLRF